MLLQCGIDPVRAFHACLRLLQTDDIGLALQNVIYNRVLLSAWLTPDREHEDIVGQHLDGAVRFFFRQVERRIGTDRTVTEEKAQQRQPDRTQPDETPQHEKAEVERKEYREAQPQIGQQRVVDRIEPVDIADQQHQQNHNAVAGDKQPERKFLNRPVHLVFIS